MIRLAVERPVSTLIGAATLVVLGVFSLLRLPVALLPELERPRIVVTATSETRSREQMLHGMTEPLERRLSSLAGITSIRSETEDGESRIVLETAWQVDIDRLQIEATRRVEGAGDFTPSELAVQSTGGDASPIVEVAVMGGESAGVRTAFATKVLVPELSRIEGAGRVEVSGSRPLHAVVRPLSAALAARGLSAKDLVDRLRQLGQSIAAGQVRDGAAIRPLVIRESITSLDRLRQVEIPTPTGAVYLGDVARVSFEEVGGETSFRLDGADAVLLSVHRAPRANAVALARRVSQRVTELGSRSGQGITLRIARDSSGEVVSALRELALAGLAGILLGTIVLRFMLGHWAPTLALSVVIPASMLTAFAAFDFFDIPLDVISLAGLALAAGMLVDNSIVVLEAIETARAAGRPDPAITGAQQIARAVMASCITTLVVFLPLVYLHGLARAFFGEQAFAVVTSLAASLLFSLTLTPLLARRGGSGKAGQSPGLAFYQRTLARALESPRGVMIGGAVALALALPTAGLLRRELFPPSAVRAIEVSYQLPHDLSHDEAERRSRVLEETVAAAARSHKPSEIQARRGIEEITGAGGEHLVPTKGKIELRFDSAAAARQASRSISERLDTEPGVLVEVRPRPSAFVESLGARGSGLEIVVSAADETRLMRLAQEVQKSVGDRFGVEPEAEGIRSARPAAVLRWDEPRLAQLGIGREQLEEQVRAALGKFTAGRIDIVGIEPEIRVEGSIPADLSSLPLTFHTSEGTVAEVPLAALARVETVGRAWRTHRQQQRPAVRLLLPPDSRIDGFELARHLRSLPIAGDESIRLSGEALDLAEAFSQLRLALALSLVLVFLTIAAIYESFLLSLLIMTTVPVAAAGGLLSLALFGQSLNLMSIIGFILLGGIVVDNAIVLIDRVEALRREGRDEESALRQAGSERYRPILMTTATTLLGMLPLAFLGGDGIELRRALAIAVLGGLITSTFASLILVPILHRAIERFRGFRRARHVVREEAA